MAKVTIKDVSKIYDGGIKAVDDISLEIHDREFMDAENPLHCV